MKSRALLLLIGLLVANRIIAQTTVPLAGACTDCAAVITAFNNCSVASAGTPKAGTVVGTGVTQTIQLTVGKVGKYNLSTTNNGITFAASGTFTTLGLQTVVLTASGYTVSGGTTTFALSSNGQSCTFDRTVGGATTVITGPCPSNLKYKELSLGFGPSIQGDRDGGFGLSKDSVLYGLPGGIYGKSAIGNLEDVDVPDGIIISPVKIQNIPKVVTTFMGLTGNNFYFVGVDGNMYAIR